MNIYWVMLVSIPPEKPGSHRTYNLPAQCVERLPETRTSPPSTSRYILQIRVQKQPFLPILIPVFP